GRYKESNIIIYKKSLHISGEKGTIIDTQNKGYGFYKKTITTFRVVYSDLYVIKITTCFTNCYCFCCCKAG
ncbi:MAG: nitrous oxide reductase family maturation protein NosD, partial [Bacteroidota bacterium]